MAHVSGVEIVVMAVTHRHPHRADRYFNLWYFMLDFAPDSVLFHDVHSNLSGHWRCGHGVLALGGVCTRLSALLRPFEIRCYRCHAIRGARLFAPDWHVRVWHSQGGRCSVCRRYGERCAELLHPHCYQCRIEWESSGDSD